MAGSLIDASLRRATLLAEARGFTVPDTKPDLDPTPQIIIEGDDEEIFLDFTDRLGHSTTKKAYRNFGSSFIWVHNGKVQYSASSQSITDDLDDADPGVVPVFDEQSGKYAPLVPRGVAAITVQVPEDRTYQLIPELPFDVQVIDTYAVAEAGPATVVFSSGSVGAGQPLEAVVSGTDGTSSYLTLQIVFRYNLGTQ